MGVDFNGAKPVMTVRDDEFKMKLVDGASGSIATKILSIVNETDAFSAGVNTFGIPCIVKNSAGDAKILQLDAAGGLPVTISNASVAISATDLDIRDLAFATDKVDVSGSSVSISGSVVVTATDLDIRNLAYTTDSVTSYQGGTWTVAVSGSVAVTATDLDIRDLAFATDKVDVSGSSVTVSATDLDVRDLAFATDKVDVSGSSVSVSGTVAVSSTDLDIRDLAFATDKVDASGSSITLTNAQGADGAAAPSSSVQVAGKDATGNLQTILTTTTGAVVVKVDNASGVDPVFEYETSATVGVGSTVNHDYLITSGKTFTAATILVGARGAVKVEVGTWDGTTFVPKMVYFQDPKENIDHNLGKLELVGDGILNVRIRITNLDGNSSDVYSTLQAEEV